MCLFISSRSHKSRTTSDGDDTTQLAIYIVLVHSRPFLVLPWYCPIASMAAGRPFKAILLDIEGTTTPITFVTEVLFPYAQDQYSNFIKAVWSTSDFLPTKQAFAAQDSSLTSNPDALIQFVRGKHAKNEKHTAFKSLQGDIWKAGYKDGTLKSIVYPDVTLALDEWKNNGIETYIYSSGSVPAQKLLFQYTNHGDLRSKLRGYFDTSTAGSKTEASSYTTIITTTGIEANDWLFLSDNVKEVVAAQEAGMESYVVQRPGNAELSAEDQSNHRIIKSFDGIR